MPRYVWRDGAFRDAGGEAMQIPQRAEVCAPNVQSDISEYRSPIDGRPITSRSHRRYDLESNGCVEAPPRKRGYRNPQFAHKRGLEVTAEPRQKRPA